MRRSPARWTNDKVRQVRAAVRKEGQLGLLLLASHPLQAIVLGGLVGGLALLSDRTFGQAVMACLAVLLVQLALGLHNDVSDAALDRKAKRATKPIGMGELPSGNATYLAIVLLVLAIPVSLQSGTVAGFASSGGPTIASGVPAFGTVTVALGAALGAGPGTRSSGAALGMGMRARRVRY